MQYLLGTDSVHTTAAICDYLGDRVTADDAVTAIAVADDATTRRDGEEALNVAPVRLAAAGDVETELRSGTPAETLLEAAAEFDADELVIGTHSGNPGSIGGLGSTAQQLLADAGRPVVVVPIPEL
ncbi:universal stress protein [Natrinema versiforme]|uniref:UspA domain-containing protein n=1 Tax=Natrinema versiforme JCM 10478 TaxID=1227496 RepID=L9XZV2_9EURY|nr:universal stress protein [Natrinema versiforme]ELY66961.1 UspA domain-containing protein [Natrinema versiforme JCM 10478]